MPASCSAARPIRSTQQIVDFTEYCGGMGNLLMMGHAGFLTHEDTVSNLDDVLARSDAAAQGLQAAGAGNRGGVTRFRQSRRADTIWCQAILTCTLTRRLRVRSAAQLA